MKHGFPCDSGRQCAGQGGVMRRVRIAEQLSREDLGVLAQQRFGIERGAGVVEIDLPARAQRTQVKLRPRVGGICRRLTLLEVRARACPRGRRRS